MSRDVISPGSGNAARADGRRATLPARGCARARRVSFAGNSGRLVSSGPAAVISAGIPFVTHACTHVRGRARTHIHDDGRDSTHPIRSRDVRDLRFRRASHFYGNAGECVTRERENPLWPRRPRIVSRRYTARGQYLGPYPRPEKTHSANISLLELYLEHFSRSCPHLFASRIYRRVLTITSTTSRAGKRLVGPNRDLGSELGN